MDLLIRNGRVIDPANGLDAPGDVLVQAGRVARVGPHIEAPAGTETIDAGGRVVAPGFIDIHVHLREPGLSTRKRSRPAPGRRRRAGSPQWRAWPTQSRSTTRAP